jgi:thymidine kinase
MSIEIVIGPMYSGKTTTLITKYQRNSSLNKIIIDYSLSEVEDRLNSVYHSVMESHGGLIAPNVYKCKKLTSLFEKKNYKMFSEDVLNYYYNMFYESTDIYINECQFFPDLKKFVLDMLSLNKNVYLYGLDGDFKQEIMGQTFELIPYCSRIEKKVGSCEMCKKESIISHRIHKSKQVYFTDPKAYIPLCLSCHDEIKNEH